MVAWIESENRMGPTPYFIPWVSIHPREGGVDY